jgi:folate-binding protein YgfZ
MNTQPTTLEHLGVLLVSGPDARNFLQGQLTADLAASAPERITLAACNSPQGRVQAVLWLVERPDGIALLLPRGLLESIAARLRRYVLRAKVTIDAGRLHVGLIDKPDAFKEHGHDRLHRVEDGTSYLRWSAHRHALTIQPHEVRGHDAERELQWRCDHLRAGLPQVYPETHEQFVAQMLNLDVLDGISFAKGCYTGQEIIARTHYRGAIKRRMFRFRAPCSPPAPGTRVVAGDQHAGDVVDSIPNASGCELLAVVSLAHMNDALTLQTAEGQHPLERLALPYEVGDEVMMPDPHPPLR